jgi:hypothetical protein
VLVGGNFENSISTEVAYGFLTNQKFNGEHQESKNAPSGGFSRRNETLTAPLISELCLAHSIHAHPQNEIDTDTCIVDQIAYPNELPSPFRSAFAR